MSPEIRSNGKLIADVPDETGMYQALDGTPLRVDVSGIEASNSRQVILVEGSAVGETREIGLSQEGKGDTNNPKRKGDNQNPPLEILLRERPIRVTYGKLVWTDNRSLAYPNERALVREDRKTYKNPRWVKGHGQR